ncbi:MAG: S-layer homology domain-containing protein, partial [Gemmatimonadales bacterium]|nr:S-layer homology domain-containing protein [Gemmatimonadales bacterium]
SFRDVPEDYWCFKYVEYLVEAAVAFGYPDGNYYPTRRVTRDQMAVYISRGFGFDM